MQGPDTRAPCEQPPPQSIRSAHLFRFLCALCPRALESPSQPFRAAIDLSGALLWLTHPRPSSRRDSAVTSFLSPPWHGDQVPLEPGSGSARPPERIPVLGGACVPNPHPVYPQSGGARVPILSEPAQSSPAVLQPAVGPTQPHYPGPGAAGDTATEWVRPRRQPRAPSLRPAPAACACPTIYPARVTAGPAPACCPAPLPRACHVGRSTSSAQSPGSTWSSTSVHPRLASYLSRPHPPFLSNSILDSQRPRRLLYSLEIFHLSFCALCEKQPGLYPKVECPSLGRSMCFNTPDESKHVLYAGWSQSIDCFSFARPSQPKGPKCLVTIQIKDYIHILDFSDVCVTFS